MKNRCCAMTENVLCAVAALSMPLAAAAGFAMDRSVMSEAYWNVWNDDDE